MNELDTERWGKTFDDMIAKLQAEKDDFLELPDATCEVKYTITFDFHGFEIKRNATRYVAMQKRYE